MNRRRAPGLLVTGALLIALVGCAGKKPAGEPGAVAESVTAAVPQSGAEPQLAPETVREQVRHLQETLDANGLDWIAGETSLSALTALEFSTLCGEITEQPSAGGRTAVLALASARRRPALPGLPPGWDWRSLPNWTTPIRDQGGCGSCVAHAAVAVLESLQQIDALNPLLQPDLSEADLFYCGCGACCNVGWTLEDAAARLKVSGLVDETCWPYTPRNQPCLATNCQPGRTIAAYRRLYTVQEMKESLVANGPLLGRLMVFDDLRHYAGGVYRPSPGSVPVGGHAIAIVGYDDTKRAWIAKNSWGTSWGESERLETCAPLPPLFDQKPPADTCGWFRIGYGAAGIDAYAIELSLTRQDGPSGGGAAPGGGDGMQVLTFAPNDGTWHATGFNIDAETGVRVWVSGDACPGGGAPCGEPGYVWLPMARVGSQALQLPEAVWTVTADWIGGEGPLSFALGDTKYDDNTGQTIIRLKRFVP